MRRISSLMVVLTTVCAVAGAPVRSIWASPRSNSTNEAKSVDDGSIPPKGSSPPASSTMAARKVSEISLLKVGAIDPAALLSEDLGSASSRPGPIRFTLAADVTISPAQSGTWEDLPTGARLWRLRVHAPNATDLNFGFKRYRLPPGATLHIIAEVDGFYQGPYTSDDNKDHGELWTAVVPGERAVIEVFVPSSAAFEPEIELGRIGRGYRDLFRRGEDFDKRGACNINVVCPQGDPWRDQIRAVAMYFFDGMYLCTGTLVNDVPGSLTPYFLSAAHCGVSTSNDHTVVVYWNHQTDHCATFNDPNWSENQSGSTLRASYAPSDLLLMELDSQPVASANVFYAGWDARDQTPSATTAIHHPGGDEKSISFDDDPSTVTSYGGSSSPGSGTHLRIADWDEGTTEPGSSGSCLFDKATGRCVGTLTGGLAACGNDESDWYGRVSRHWSGGGTASTRLSNWLDPSATGTLFMDGVNGVGGGGCTNQTGSCGGTVNGSITSEDCMSGPRGSGYYAEAITFSGTSGQSVTITATWSGVNGYLYLTDSSGTEVASNDDYNGTGYSQIQTTLPSSGTYTIWATTFSSGSTGSYSIEISCGGGGGDGVNVSDCGNASYDDGTAEYSLWFGGGGAGLPDNMYAVKFELADFGFTPGNTQITGFCAGNLLAWSGGPWLNEVFIYPDSGGMPDDGTVLGQGTIATGDGAGWYEVTLAAPVTLNGDFWLVNRGDPEWAGDDFNMDTDTSSADAGQSFGSATGIANLTPSVSGNYLLRATLQSFVPGEAISSDGFESGDASAWSSSFP